jgi:hypothetical protein
MSQRHMKIVRLFAAVVVTSLLSSCGSNGASSEKTVATPSSNPGDVVVWDPTSTVSTTIAQQQLPLEKREAAMVPILNMLGLNPDLPEIADLEPYMQNKTTMSTALKTLRDRYPGNREYDVRADTFQKLPDEICEKLRAGEGCVEVSFYILLEGQPATPLIKAQITPSGDQWLLSEYGLCRIMLSMAVACGIEFGPEAGVNPALPNES